MEDKEKEKIQSILFKIERWEEEARTMMESSKINSHFWNGKRTMAEQVIDLLKKSFEVN